MENSSSGTCLCGKIKYVIHGSFESFFLCHCKYCQKDSGSAHSANLFSTSAKIEWLSGEENVKTFNLPSTRHVKSFCMDCGSGMPNLQAEGKLLVVPAGSLDGPVQMKPNAHLYVSSKASWDVDLENIPKIEKLPL